MKLKIKKLDKNARLPKYAHTNDAGMDLFSIESKTLESGERFVCRTGIAMAIPTGYVGLIWDKSGVAAKGGIKTMGGVVDSSYRGEVGVVLKNLSKEKYEIKKGEKIAQMLIQKIENPEIEEVDDLESTERGNGGFGSTGLK
jgi:dUTP pyrophosphatase